MKKIFYNGKNLLLVLIVAFFFVFCSIRSSALSSAEIDALVSSQQKVLDETTSSIRNIQNEIQNLESGYNSNKSELDQMKANVSDLDNKISQTISIAETLDKDINIKSDEILKIQEGIKKSILAINVRISKSQNNLYYSKEVSNNSSVEYLKKLLDSQNKKLSKIITERISTVNTKQQAELQHKKLLEQKAALVVITENISSKVSSLLAQISQKDNLKTSLSNKVLSIQSTIIQLGEEQKIALQREKEILQEQTKAEMSKNTEESYVPNKFIKGEVYFSGRGRDLYDGHAIGMSQWGAYGAAQKGIDYKKILTSYYTNTSVEPGYENRTINVSGYGKMNIEQYLSGIGEVPDFACETTENKGKSYVTKDDPNSDWDCWPEEAIKAQVVAARSYAIGSTESNPNKAVATDASFQVYDGGNGKAWAAEATKGEVVEHNGDVATTYYTASLRGHSEDNELFWTAKSLSTVSLNALKGTKVEYLRGVDDSSWEFQNKYYNWKWKTNSISLEKLKEIIQPSTGDIGKITNIEADTGSSNRVWAVTIQGDKSTVYMAGWKFKSLINDYLYDFTTDRNYMFSTEFTIEEVK